MCPLQVRNGTIEFDNEAGGSPLHMRGQYFQPSRGPVESRVHFPLMSSRSPRLLDRSQADLPSFPPPWLHLPEQGSFLHYVVPSCSSFL